jgi:hypothetical protein
LPEDSGARLERARGREYQERALRFAKAHWHILLVIAIMVAAFLLRLYYLSKHTEYTADSYYFLILARSIRDTFTYTVRGITHTKYLPGYPITIWLGGFIVGGLQRSANLIAVLGGTFTVLVTYGIGNELFNKWAGVTAALIVAFQPTFLKWTVLPMTEGLFTFLFAGGIYLLITGFKRASLPRRTLGAVAGGLCFLVRWEGLLFLPLMVLIAILYFRGSELAWWEPLVMLFVFGLPIGIYVARNLIVTGKTTSYVGEFRDYSIKVSFAVLKHRAKVYVWNGMSDALFSALFFIGAVYSLVRKKWKAFLIVGGWFAIFAGFHLFWYYAYERFMAPAVPAVGLFIGFLFADLAALSWKFFKDDGWVARKLGGAQPDIGTAEDGDTPAPDAAPADRPRRAERHRRQASSGMKLGLRAAQVVCLVVLALLLATVVWHGLARADVVIKQNYLAFADDHGGQGMKQAAGWLNRNAPGQLVAADAGPFFEWLYYPGDVLYMRPVPWDLPVEPADIAYENVPRRLYERGVRYLVIGQTEKGVDDELKLFGIVGIYRPFVREVKRWVNHYTYPEPHDLTTVIFEVLPPG